jgi:hypothetical protein
MAVYLSTPANVTAAKAVFTAGFVSPTWYQSPVLTQGLDPKRYAERAQWLRFSQACLQLALGGMVDTEGGLAQGDKRAATDLPVLEALTSAGAYDSFVHYAAEARDYLADALSTFQAFVDADPGSTLTTP